VSTTELLTLLLSIGGSLLTAWGGYKLFQGRTEEWRMSVKDRLKGFDEITRVLRRRTHRHASRLLTHELEIDQIMRKLGIPRSHRRDDDYDEEGRLEDE
jgi:hypothetical protein